MGRGKPVSNPLPFICTEVHRLRTTITLKLPQEIAALGLAKLRAPPGRSFIMETTAAKQAREKSITPPGRSTPERNMSQASAARIAAAGEKKSVGYGLPCSNCHAYYPADMHICPICQSPERVSPTESAALTMASMASEPASQLSSPMTSAFAVSPQIDDDRERFLKELKSQAFASHTQINAAATFRCVLTHQHSGATEPAAVCHTCYGEVRQQADRMEAALHMDAKEAAKIVYEAVWADTSDPNVTYLNAARALLSELQKRAGIGLMLGSNQPLTH